MMQLHRSQLRAFACLSVLGLSATTAGLSKTVFAEGKPATEAHAKDTTTEKPRKKKLNKKLSEAVEAKLGKPLTEEQKDQLLAADAVRMEAIKAAQDKYYEDFAKATGLTVDDAKAIIHAPREKKADAPAEAAKPAE